MHACRGMANVRRPWAKADSSTSRRHGRISACFAACGGGRRDLEDRWLNLRGTGFVVQLTLHAGILEEEKLAKQTTNMRAGKHASHISKFSGVFSAQAATLPLDPTLVIGGYSLPAHSSVSPHRRRQRFGQCDPGKRDEFL